MAMKACRRAVFAALGVAAAASPALAAEKLPDRITMQTAGITPEGVEYDTKNHRFLVGSITQGTVFVVAADGTLTPFIKDPELKASVGIEVDEERNRLLVANSDGSVFGGQGMGQAKLGVYDLASGKRLAMVDLAAVAPAGVKHFANDVTVGADGSAYVTDTMARVVYKVTPKYAASVLLPNTFGANADRPMFNGIVFHPAGYLLVADSVGGDVYKVPVDKPEGFTKVKLPEPVTGADGLLWHPDNCLIAVRNDKSNLVVALKSDDNWASARLDSKGTASKQATTAALTGGAVYVVYPFFGDAKTLPVLERVHLQ